MSIRELPTIDKQIDELRTTVDELKTIQPIYGDSWIYYKVVISDSVWDTTKTLSANAVVNYRIVFTPNDPTILTVVNLRFYDDVPSGGYTLSTLAINNTNYEWRVRVKAGGSGVTYYMKVIATASQDGTLSFTEL